MPEIQVDEFVNRLEKAKKPTPIADNARRIVADFKISNVQIYEVTKEDLTEDVADRMNSHKGKCSIAAALRYQIRSTDNIFATFRDGHVYLGRGKIEDYIS